MGPTLCHAGRADGNAAGGVGKSALTVRWVRDVFLETYDPTIEGEHSSGNCAILGFIRLCRQRSIAAWSRSTASYPRCVSWILTLITFRSDLSFLQLEVLDTAGAEQFTSLNEVYIKVWSISSRFSEVTSIFRSLVVDSFLSSGESSSSDMSI